MNIDWLFKNIETTIHTDDDSFGESIIYLDAEQLSQLYSSISGLKGRPTIEVQKISGEFKANLLFALGSGISGEISKSFEVSDAHLLKAIYPKIRKRYRQVLNLEEFWQNQGRKVWLKGIFSYDFSSYPSVSKFNLKDVNSLQLEWMSKSTSKFYFDGIHCTIPFIENYLSSIYRSLYLGKKSFEENVDLLAYIHKYNEVKTGTTEHPTMAYVATISPIFILRTPNNV